MDTISSRQNALVKAFRSLARGRDGSRTLLDGEHLVGEALDAGVRLTVAATTAKAPGKPRNGRRRSLTALAERLAREGTRVVSVSEQVMEVISPVRAPSGIVAIAEIDPPAPERVLSGPMPVVPVLAGVQDPGNLGAIVRTAEAAGATGLIACLPSADPFGWKALRGAMGSTFRLPVPERMPLADTLKMVRERGLVVMATVPRGGRPLQACDFCRPIALLLGGEGAGLDEDLLREADERLSIPMRPPVESLNVAVSAGVILYEAYRQRVSACQASNS